MLGVLIAIVIYWQNPPGNTYIDILALIAIGFMIYGPMMLIALHAIDLVPKNAAGTAAGLIGIFGYLIGVVCTNLLIGILLDNFGWNGAFQVMIFACLGTINFLAISWKYGIDQEKRLLRSTQLLIEAHDFLVHGILQAFSVNKHGIFGYIELFGNYDSSLAL